MAVLMGGISAEREISLQSGAAVLAALQRQGVVADGIDAGPAVLDDLAAGDYRAAFIALHGRWGEDGVIQGALEVVGLPYTGSGVLGSALAMDKIRCKQVWSAAGIPTPAFAVPASADGLDDCAQEIGFPLMVKPNREGSSLGIAKVESTRELQDAWHDAARYDDEVLLERWIGGSEFTASILQDHDLPLIRLETPHEFYDYEAKYSSDTTRYVCPCGLEPARENELRDLAKQAFDVLGCSGWGRVDFMLDDTGAPYFLEVNTVPGMTDHSLVPMAAEHAGIEFDQLVTRILETASEHG